MPGPLSQPHGHTPDGRRINGKSAMKDARVTSCRACPITNKTKDKP